MLANLMPGLLRTPSPDSLDALGMVPRRHPIALFANQFRSPLVLILIAASVISMLVSSWMDAAVVLVIVLGSTVLGFAQEFVAGNALARLRSLVMIRCVVLRDGKETTLPASQLQVGDVVLLTAGGVVPADGRIIESRNFYVNEAALTGETFPVAKSAAPVDAGLPMAQRRDAVFMGTSVQSGTARMQIERIGLQTEFGRIARRLELCAPMTDFERGVRQFGDLLARVMLILLVMVLGASIIYGRPAIDSFMFAIALAVGLTPELLPAIISITLSHGARRMAKGGVIVRKLNAIENLGSMDVLCTDKTGTLTIGGVALHAAFDPGGQASPRALRLALINAQLQSGMDNPMDGAIVQAGRHGRWDIADVQKVDEIPLDFSRKCLSVVVDDPAEGRLLITKGAFEKVLERCTSIAGASPPLDERCRERLRAQHHRWADQGFRVLGLASRRLPNPTPSSRPYAVDDERELVLEGMLLFLDPPKPDTSQTIGKLQKRGVALKIITGDDHKTAMYVARSVGLGVDRAITGEELAAISDDALMQVARQQSLFAEVDPNQKERIVRALKRTGGVVGFMGDGINDVLALHTADVGISVSNAVDVAREASDFVLLHKELDIVCRGIDEGRRTFANTMKYVLTTISANFGNMISMGAASLVLPFLPLLPSQILLNNLLSDVPAMALASDRVDRDRLIRPRRWDTRLIRDHMVTFGLISSAFDLLAFAALIWLFKAGVDEFRTAWFVESLLTELAVALVVRTPHRFFASRPGGLLLAATLIIAVVAVILPYVPLASLFGFVPLPASVLSGMILLTLAYVGVVELAKGRFYQRMERLAG